MGVQKKKKKHQIYIRLSRTRFRVIDTLRDRVRVTCSVASFRRKRSGRGGLERLSTGSREASVIPDGHRGQIEGDSYTRKEEEEDVER